MFFFTVVTDRRQPIFRCQSARSLLGDCLRQCRTRWTFEIMAIVLLPDHLHAIWSLPSGDSNYSVRWSWIKKEFSKRWLGAGHHEYEISAARRREGRRGVWQPRFWEHTIKSDDDYERHFDYIHYNPVKHGFVRCPHEWPHSSFHRWVKQGVYPWHWACWNDSQRSMNFDDMNESVGE
ncbi:transposase [Thalassoglobus sp. JC818]|uniref:REP-associated tyrosine transposase n=1 Tax=Thalassoglobus sp. JC818 TaxID=3232136 RepID=UPI003459FC3C